MTLDDYQKQAMKTCLKSSANFSYMSMNLVAEVGEFSGKVSKSIRKGEKRISNNDLIIDNISLIEYEIQQNDLKYEVGDILWQLSGLCSVLGWSLQDIAEMNIEKLQSRQERNKIEGSGDNR